MSTKLTFFLLWELCLFSIGYAITAEEEQKWLDSLIDKFGASCRHTISDESFQLFKDDMEFDNEEVRDFKLCLSEKNGYMKLAKIDSNRILDDYMKYAISADILERQIAKNIIKICKAEAESSSDGKDVAGRFSNCIMDRTKTSI